MGQALGTLALWLLIARILTPDAIGQYALAVSLAAIFANVCKVGFERLAIREVARHRDRAATYLGDILILKGGLAIVRETGFACACSAFADFVWQGTKRFELPRVFVRDWDGDEFARRLRAFFSA